jgi:hypothetical protein
VRRLFVTIASDVLSVASFAGEQEIASYQGSVMITPSDASGEAGALILATDREPQIFVAGQLDAPHTIAGTRSDQRSVLAHTPLHRASDGYVQAQGSELIFFDKSLTPVDYLALEKSDAMEQVGGFSSGVNSPSGVWSAAAGTGIIAMFDASSRTFRSVRVGATSVVEGPSVESCVPEPLLLAGQVLARAGNGIAVIDQQSLEVQQYIPTDGAVLALGSGDDSRWTLESGYRVVSRDTALAPTGTSTVQVDTVAVV